MFQGIQQPIETPLSRDEMKTKVEKHFDVESASTSLKGQVPIYIYRVDDQERTKQPFKRLLTEVQEHQYRVLLRHGEEKDYLKVIAVPMKEAIEATQKKSKGKVKREPRKEAREEAEEAEEIEQILPQQLEEEESGFPRWTIISLIATLGMMAFSGYQFTLGFRQQFPSTNIFPNVLFYIIALISIIATHEFGHMFASRLHDIEATYPIFIPGYPFGTFGAFIKQESPPANRDELFDLGIMGPLFGFLVAIPVSVVGILLSRVPAGAVSEIEGIIQIPRLLLFQFLTSFNPSLGGADFLLHPIAVAGWVGFLLTGLNLLPVSQLDGGHISKAMFKGNIPRYLSYVVIGFLFLSGFFLMAIFLLFFTQGRHPPPLDNVSAMSQKRTVAGVLSWGIILLTFPINPILELGFQWALF